MNALEKFQYRIIFYLTPNKTRQTINKICIEELAKIGIEQKINVLHLRNGFQSVYLIQIFSKKEIFRKAKIIALLHSLIIKKISPDVGKTKINIKLIINIADPLVGSFISRIDRLSIRNIEYLLAESTKRRTSTSQDSQTKQHSTFIKTVAQVELDTSKSVSVSEIDFEEYLSVANNKLRTLIAEKREEHRSINQDFLNTAPIA